MRYYILIFDGVPKGESGESVENEYDLSNACKECGTMAQLTGSLKTKGLQSVRKDFFETVDGDKIISERLFKEIRLLKTSLTQVVDIKTGLLPFYHLTTNVYFPKSLAESEGLITENQCSDCLQDGYFNDVIIGNIEKGIPTQSKPLKLVYENVDISFLREFDLFNTWEHMGNSNLNAEGKRVVRYARPMLIVSESVKEVFERFKVKNSVFDEVTFK